MQWDMHSERMLLRSWLTGLAGCTSAKTGRGEDYKDKQNNPMQLKLTEESEEMAVQEKASFSLPLLMMNKLD